MVKLITFLVDIFVLLTGYGILRYPVSIFLYSCYYMFWLAIAFPIVQLSYMVVVSFFMDGYNLCFGICNTNT